jgi:predicted metalloprotease with PDZ domain
MAVEANQIRFEDMLDTLSRAYAMDNRQRERVSLIDASKKRWTGSDTDVYARGMLVAFLCDLTMLENSKAKRPIADLLREIYERHRTPNLRLDGNNATLALLRSSKGLAPIVTRYIEGNEKIDWHPLLRAAGLEAEDNGRPINLRVAARPSGRQKDLLNKLGYNSWRKLSRKQ